MLPNLIPLMNLDHGVAVDIFRRLPIQSVGASSVVCRDWNTLLNTIWKAVANQQFDAPVKIASFSSYIRLESNPRKGRYSLITLPNIKAPIASQGHLLFACALNDTVIEKWDWTNKNFMGKFIGNHEKIASLAVTKNGEWLFSRTDQGTVSKWSVKDYTLQAACSDPKGANQTEALILTIAKKFLTNSADGAIKVWDGESCHLIDTIPCIDPISHVSSWAMDEKNQRLFAGYADGRIRVWSLASPISCIATHDLDLEDPDLYGKDIKSMVLKGNSVFFSCQWMVKKWNCESNLSETILGRFSKYHRPIAVHGNILFSGYNNCEDINIYDMNDLEEAEIVDSVVISTHDAAIRALYVKEGVVFSATYETVKILDFTKDPKKISDDYKDTLYNLKIALNA